MVTRKKKKPAAKKAAAVEAAAGGDAEADARMLVALLDRGDEAMIEVINVAIRNYDDQIDALKRKRATQISTRKLLQLKIHGRPTRLPAEECNRRADAAAEFLAEHGPAQRARIAAGAGIPLAALDKVLRTEPRFERVGRQRWGLVSPDAAAESPEKPPASTPAESSQSMLDAVAAKIREYLEGEFVAPAAEIAKAIGEESFVVIKVMGQFADFEEIDGQWQLADLAD